MASAASEAKPAVIKSVQFEVFGKVQGVFFRKVYWQALMLFCYYALTPVCRTLKSKLGCMVW
jgi:hypothetical protein